MMTEAHHDDPYRTAFERCGAGSTILSDQEWVQFLDLLVDTEFLKEELAQRFRQEHEGQPHSLENFERDLCKWVEDPICSQVDGIIDDMKKKMWFLRQVIEARHDADPIDVNFLHSVVTQAEAAKDTMAELEETSRNTLASKWLESNLFGSTNEPAEFDSVCPWKFQQANARYLRVEDRQRARYQLCLHQCDENTDRVLKEMFYPVLQQFREVQAGVATLASRKRHESDEDEELELAIVIMVRRQSASEEALVWLDNLVAAYRQLSLSPYIQQYLGSEDVSGVKQEALARESLTTRHYFECIKARSLPELLSDEGLLLETSPLFKLYARELLLAIIDVLEQSTYHLNGRLLPDNVLVSHSGRRLFLGKLDFGDYIDPFESKSLSTVMEKREKSLLQDLAVILFSMLYPVTLPRNLRDFRTQYLGNRDSNFMFRYRFTTKNQRSNETAVCVSCNDTFAIVLTGNSPFDEMWNFRVSKPGVLVCIDRHYSPMEFHFRAKVKGRCTITFSPLGTGTIGDIAVKVTICLSNFRLHQSKAQTLISALSGDSQTLPHELSPRMLLHQHEYFQLLSKSESHEAERELLQRV
ncbi:hypothetical protein P3T76_007306 [Phytophthora citrophthora]|uniref:Uncharacterized protein n=1 Tax=Phytophthora citrophthora TaxID=4793 RepID=A0AAD9GMP3_9STRA|nr:hypothetical protein P3T76_007306 [Phytophthora citrophthora]